MQNANIKPETKKDMPSVVVTIGPYQGLPWWWEEIKPDRGLCDLDYKRITFKDKRSKQITTLELPFLFLKVLPFVLRARNRYDYVYTFECDLTSFIISFWQTILFLRKPKHVILQFIMREKTNRISSRIKYFVMKFIFISLHKAICSAKAETAYYNKAFGWQENKTAFVPFHTANEFLNYETSDTDNYIFSGGRVFRDYKTLINAIDSSNHKTIIVSENIDAILHEHQTHITLLHNISLQEFNSLLAKSRIVVLPLENRQLSAGQIVLLQAMAMGKAIIATRTAGTKDYVEHNKNGILVEPENPVELRNAIDALLIDENLRNKLGAAAKQTVVQHYLPHHYTKNVRGVLTE